MVIKPWHRNIHHEQNLLVLWVCFYKSMIPQLDIFYFHRYIENIYVWFFVSTYIIYWIHRWFVPANGDFPGTPWWPEGIATQQSLDHRRHLLGHAMLNRTSSFQSSYYHRSKLKHILLRDTFCFQNTRCEWHGKCMIRFRDLRCALMRRVQCLLARHCGGFGVPTIDVLFPLVGWLIEGFEETPFNR